MIFVTVGTTQYDFPRLVKLCLELASKNLNQKFIIQSGSYNIIEKISPNVFVQNFFTYEETQEFIKKSDQVITHCGMGTLLQCFFYSKKPIVLPREKKLFEHVNDHQLELASLLSDRKLIFCVKNTESMSRLINTPKQKKNYRSSSVNKRKLIFNLKENIQC